MNIFGKEYRTIKPLESNIENDVQGGLLKSKSDIYIYISDNMNAIRFYSKYNRENNLEIFGNIPSSQREIQLENLNKTIKKRNDPVSIGNYKITEKDKVEIIWKYHGDIEIIFEGQILLNGDAIRGTFYKNGEVNVPERVYYNIDKSLPNPLLEEK